MSLVRTDLLVDRLALESRAYMWMYHGFRWKCRMEGPWDSGRARLIPHLLGPVWVPNGVGIGAEVSSVFLVMADLLRER